MRNIAINYQIGLQPWFLRRDESLIWYDRLLVCPAVMVNALVPNLPIEPSLATLLDKMVAVLNINQTMKVLITNEQQDVSDRLHSFIIKLQPTTLLIFGEKFATNAKSYSHSNLHIFPSLEHINKATIDEKKVIYHNLLRIKDLCKRS